MDNLTHTLTGICLSRAGLNRFTPLATLILVVASNVPDSDIITLLGGSESYLHWHRHLTHSLMAAPLLAMAIAFAFRFFQPSLSLLPVFFIALCGVASHLLEDLTNVYGVRLLLPFNSTWFDWDLTPVIDLWIWAAFGIAMMAPFLSRLVGSEIGERRVPGGGRSFAIAALLFVILYNGGRAIVHSRLLTVLDSREYADAAPRRVAAFPASMNPLSWRGVVETDSAYLLFDFKLPAAFDPAVADTVLKAQPSAAITEAAKTSPFRVLAEFAQYPVYNVTPRPEGGTAVRLSDLRFGFTSTALLKRDGQVEKSLFEFGTTAPR